MNTDIEARLLAAFRAAADVIGEPEATEPRRYHRSVAARADDGGGRLSGWVVPLAREPEPDEFPGSEHTAELPIIDLVGKPSRRQHRWLAPALAVAAIAAVAIGAVVIATDQPSTRLRPNPPATHVSSPPPSASPPVPTDAPTPSPSASQTRTAVVPTYLPSGRTGSRGQVPWSLVGSGWRLVQPAIVDLQSYERSLYLYDPSNGRYLITGALPAGALLTGWSPGGGQAMFAVNTPQAGTGLYQVQLRSGAGALVLRSTTASFVAYAEPTGGAFLVQQPGPNNGWQLSRYAGYGGLEYSYPLVIGGRQVGGGAVYTADGTELILTSTTGTPFLIGNDGHFIRTFRVPAGYQGCTPVKLWTAGTVLENCFISDPAPRGALVVQPLSGAAPTTLADGPGTETGGYEQAWQLSNGDVLLHANGQCDDGGYRVLHPGTGAITVPRLPAEVSAHPFMLSMEGDQATFLVGGSGCVADHPGAHTLLDYNLVTGQTRILLQQSALILPWPGDPH
jgi:TolB protein